MIPLRMFNTLGAWIFLAILASAIVIGLSILLPEEIIAHLMAIEPGIIVIVFLVLFMIVLDAICLYHLVKEIVQKGLSFFTIAVILVLIFILGVLGNFLYPIINFYL